MRNTAPTIHSFICSVPIYMQISFRIVNSYPHEMKLYPLDYSICVYSHQRLFSLIASSQSTVFGSYLDQKLFLKPPSVRLCYKFFCHNLHSNLVDSLPSVLFFFFQFVYIKLPSLRYKFYGFDKYIVLYIHH